MERILYTCLPGGRSHGARPAALDAGRLGVAAPTHAEAPLRKEQPAKRPQGTDDGHYPRDSHSPGREGGSGGQGLCPRPPGIWGDSQTAAGHGASSAAPWGPASSRHGAFAPEREPALTWLCLRLPRGARAGSGDRQHGAPDGQTRGWEKGSRGALAVEPQPSLTGAPSLPTGEIHSGLGPAPPSTSEGRPPARPPACDGSRGPGWRGPSLQGPRKKQERGAESPHVMGVTFAEDGEPGTHKEGGCGWVGRGRGGGARCREPEPSRCLQSEVKSLSCPLPVHPPALTPSPGKPSFSQREWPRSRRRRGSPSLRGAETSTEVTGRSGGHSGRSRRPLLLVTVTGQARWPVCWEGAGMLPGFPGSRGLPSTPTAVWLCGRNAGEKPVRRAWESPGSSGSLDLLEPARPCS